MSAVRLKRQRQQEEVEEDEREKEVQEGHNRASSCRTTV